MSGPDGFGIWSQSWGTDVLIARIGAIRLIVDARNPDFLRIIRKKH
jgi:hypothetical protein